MPDWYQELGDQKRKSNAGHRAYAIQQGTEQKEVTKDNTTSISDLVMELVRVLKQIPHDPIHVNHTGEYADGSTKQVTQSGFVNLFGKIKLVDTLYVPSFHSNLIFVHKTCATSNIRFTFLSSHCILQDNLTKTIVAVAKHSKHLYIMDKDPFSLAFMNQFLSSHFSFVSQVVGSDLSLWHQKLGHPSHKVLAHVPDEDMPTSIPLANSSPLPTTMSGSSSPVPNTSSPISDLAPAPLPLRQSTLIVYKALEANNTWDVTSLHPIRKLLARDRAYSWPVHQLDINNAFLYGFLDEEEFTSKLAEFGFTQSVHDHYLFIKTAPDGFLALLVYVDDILVMGPLKSLIKEVKSYLDALFTIKDLGYVKYFLGLEVARSPNGMSITQHKYVVDTISDTGMITASSVLTPLPTGIKLTLKSGPIFWEPVKYRKLIGCLLYFGFTRPDISFAVQQLSQYLQRPTEQHWHAALHVVRYFKGTPTTCLFFPSLNTFQLTTYVDADWEPVLILAAR
ncbi:UNVERIFIED_CONTAM: Retrovirus-related Pol polyprotein from transposon RE2 [Sesamum radiatum]|uniref:Retrovirus-related Pol polyprotein from transposon RE2 n=1 Tax=Sesamum radiatum TaxID=300843 RepID=A0AAW2SKX4_SESRA